MKQDLWLHGQAVDLTNCAREPIHIPGRIQPHGVLLAVSVPDGIIRHVSANAHVFLGVKASELLGRAIETLLPERFLSQLKPIFSGKAPLELNPLTIELPIQGNPINWDAIVHWSDGLLILEFEKVLDSRSEVSFSHIYRQINHALEAIEQAQDTASLCERAVQQVKALTGFHRVMVYQFDPDWNGKVIAEAKEIYQDSFLGLQYPASDIPAQARALYLRNWLRLIPKVDYTPVDLLSETQPHTLEPLDLSFSVLRSVSPMHVQYLKNMGVSASMSVSIIKDQKLWGLIACHHEKERYLPYELRQGLEFIGKHFSLQLAAKERLENFAYKVALKALCARLDEQMRRSPDFLSGLAQGESSFLKLAADCVGGAICYRGQIRLIGKTPAESEVRALVRWLEAQVGHSPVYSTNSLAAQYEQAVAFKDTASGLLCISIPEPDPSYVLWFKPEVIQTVNWSGNPEKPVEISAGDATLSPRRSFALWQQTVQLKSLPWGREEVEAVEVLRRSIIEVDLERQVDSAMKSNEELDQFAHVISHDLKEPLRGIKNLSDLLKKDAASALATGERQTLDEIGELAEKGRKLIAELYEYSKLGQVELSLAPTNLNEVVASVRARLSALIKEHDADVVVIGALPTLVCDRVRLAEVFANLITNAMKYNDSPKKRIDIGCDADSHSHVSPPVFFVRDNGIGIAPKDQVRIFRMFERLHGPESFGGGTGSGLAIVKRIIDKHSGRIWVESDPGKGSTFKFTLGPKSEVSQSVLLSGSAQGAG